jgi:hypothetical protein
MYEFASFLLALHLVVFFNNAVLANVFYVLQWQVIIIVFKLQCSLYDVYGHCQRSRVFLVISVYSRRQQCVTFIPVKYTFRHNTGLFVACRRLVTKTMRLVINRDQ